LGACNLQPVMESRRPELDGEICSNKHSPDGIRNHPVTSFHGTILIRDIGSCRANPVAEMHKELACFRVVAQFPPLDLGTRTCQSI